MQDTDWSCTEGSIFSGPDHPAAAVLGDINPPSKTTTNEYASNLDAPIERP